MGTLAGTHVSGSGNLKRRLLFEAIPYVMNFRAGMANERPEIVQRAKSDLATIGIEATNRREGFIEIAPLDKSNELDAAAVSALVAKRSEARDRKDWKESDCIATNSSPWASCSRTPRTAPPGSLRDDEFGMAPRLTSPRARGEVGS